MRTHNAQRANTWCPAFAVTGSKVNDDVVERIVARVVKSIKFYMWPEHKMGLICYLGHNATGAILRQTLGATC